ncbi:glycosyltransferase family 4 protein [Aliikangiella sp. IMCC44653]
MKILWLSHFIPYPPKGGVLQRGYHLVKQLAKYHDVHLLAFNQEDLMRPLFPSVEQGVNEAKQHLSTYCKSVSFVPLPLDKSPLAKKWMAFKSLFGHSPYTMNWLLSNEYAEKIQQLMAEHEFDFVHFDTISLAPFKVHCGNVKTSLDHHNIESHMLIRRASKEPNILKRLYFLQEGKRLEKFEKSFCPKFDFNFTCSEIDTQRLQEIAPNANSHTIANGVDTSYFVPNPEIEKVDRLIFVGTLSWYPNIEAVNFIANEIWPAIKEKHPNLQVDIIGANPPQSILDLAHQDDRFHVHGFVDDILPLLHQAKCYICPIKDGGGTKLKIVDALSIGMAIVADEIACEGINVKNNQNVLFAQTANEYVEQIESVLFNNAKREGLQQNARELALAEYSYASIGKKLAELFNHYAGAQ